MSRRIFALKFTDPIARDVILIYAEDTEDNELSNDLRIACDNAEREGNKK